MTPIDTLRIIDDLEALVETSRIKFLGFVHLDEDAYFQLTSKLRASLPEDIRRAGRLAENSDKLMEATQAEAQRLLDDARAEAERTRAEAAREAEQTRSAARTEAEMAVEEAKHLSRTLTAQTEISRIAAAQARELVAQAEREANEIRAGADAYARDLLVQLEQQIEESLRGIENKANNMLASVQRGRAVLERNISAANAAAHGATNGETAGMGGHRSNGRAT